MFVAAEVYPHKSCPWCSYGQLNSGITLAALPEESRTKASVEALSQLFCGWMTTQVLPVWRSEPWHRKMFWIWGLETEARKARKRVWVPSFAPALIAAYIYVLLLMAMATVTGSLILGGDDTHQCIGRKHLPQTMFAGQRMYQSISTPSVLAPSYWVS